MPDVCLILHALTCVVSSLQDSVSPQDIVGVKIPTVKILMREIFNSPADELYSIFTTKEVSDAFNGQYKVMWMLL